ncbi:MAG: DUF5086 family protein [Brucella pseudogrignonensis]
MGKKRSKVLILAPAALTFAAPIVNAQTPDRTIILADTVKLTRWANIHQVPDPAHNDPYYHLEVFEHKKGAKPWVFKRLAHHMVITPDALDKSRTQKQAKTYAYKDVEFWITYKHWRDNPESRAQTPVCETTIIDCLRN